eukprot:TRINITY_DN32256_c0_g1_i3.p1 TRINITY_DN32256_c0_g1~~TRINITY_DN32256_c0_g1_i3.p1  ORF type:complete len:483 (+),score=189.46 TRINITY_DN32256_c0_g1_i3:114-1562(+)
MDLDILKASTLAVGKTIAVCAVGFFMSRYPKDNPLMDANTRKGIGRILLLVMVPALAASSLAMTVTPEGFSEMYPMWGWCTLSLMIGASISYVVTRILGLRGTYQRGFLAAGTFGNNVGLPLIILSALCKQPVLEEYGPYETCRELSYGMIMFYGIPWRIAMFGLAVPLIAAAHDEDDEEEDASDPTDTILPPTSPRELQEVLGVVGGDAAGGGGGGAPAGAPCETPAGDVVQNPLSSNLMGASQSGQPMVITEDPLQESHGREGAPYRQQEKEEKEQPKIDWKKIAKGLVTDINILGPCFGVVVGLIPPLQRFFFGEKDGQPILPIFGPLLELLGEPVVAFATLGMASSLLPKGTKISSFFTWKILKEVIALCLVRFVLVPGIGVACALLGYSLGVPGSRLQWLVIIIQFCLPSPQVLIVSMVAVGKHKLASRMAPVYVVTYLTNIISLTAWTSAALALTADYPLGLGFDEIVNATLAPAP